MDRCGRCRKLINFCHCGYAGGLMHENEKDMWIAELLDEKIDMESRMYDLKGMYNNLVMAVERKFPDETRHNTALRYIRQAESASKVGSCKEVK